MEAQGIAASCEHRHFSVFLRVVGEEGGTRCRHSCPPIISPLGSQPRFCCSEQDSVPGWGQNHVPSLGTELGRAWGGSQEGVQPLTAVLRVPGCSGDAPSLSTGLCGAGSALDLGAKQKGQLELAVPSLGVPFPSIPPQQPRVTSWHPHRCRQVT